MTPRVERVYIRWFIFLFAAMIILAFLNSKIVIVPAIMLIALRGMVENYFKWRRKAFIRKFEKPGYITRKPGETDGELVERIGKFLKASTR